MIAAEKGYSAIPGAMAIPVSSWGEFLKILRELKKPEAKEMYHNIVLDTVKTA